MPSKTHTTLSWGSEQHILTMCLMIINEPSWIGREALSHPFHRQEEDWEPQGHPSVSIILPNDFSPSLTRTHVCAHVPTESGTKSHRARFMLTNPPTENSTWTLPWYDPYQSFWNIAHDLWWFVKGEKVHASRVAVEQLAGLLTSKEKSQVRDRSIFFSLLSCFSDYNLIFSCC